MELTVQNVSFSVSDVDIIKDVSLRVQEGQFVGIIGPNGCGKSTLLKNIYKVTKPTTGMIFLDDLDIVKASPKAIARRLGVVGQFNNANFDFTVRDMVLMGRTPHKKIMESDTNQDYDLVDNVLRKVNLEHHASKHFSYLSGGEKQRVILARALAQEPQFLILDEPTNHLDIKYQIQILSLVQSLKIGTLAALHDLSLAAMYCEYLYVLKNGRIYTHGEPEELLTPELVKKVYDVDCHINQNEHTKNLVIAYHPTLTI
ncbi:ABC transporter ATP-binding protein [Lysinibacillus sp. NPDC097162]|uniref:ABC transporter ATP-binding protein n=1 Tax=Lysinibacillus sp. NPDC097162 TaxID=3364140 RepID=UPI0038180D94